MKAVMVGPSSPCPQLDYVEGSFFSDVGDLSCVLYIGWACLKDDEVFEDMCH